MVFGVKKAHSGLFPKRGLLEGSPWTMDDRKRPRNEERPLREGELKILGDMSKSKKQDTWFTRHASVLHGFLIIRPTDPKEPILDVNSFFPRL